MKKVLFGSLLLASIVFGENTIPFKDGYTQASMEIQTNTFLVKLENRIFNKLTKKLKSLEKRFAESTKREDKLKVIEELQSLAYQDQSIILYSIALNKTISIINLRDLEYVRKYIKPSADFLYKNRLCDGYLFKGEYEKSLNSDSQRALKIYEEGINNCKVEWKKFFLVGRFEKLSYITNQRSK